MKNMINSIGEIETKCLENKIMTTDVMSFYFILFAILFFLRTIMPLYLILAPPTQSEKNCLFVRYSYSHFSIATSRCWWSFNLSN